MATYYEDFSSEHEFLLELFGKSYREQSEELHSKAAKIDWRHLFAITPPDLYGYLGVQAKFTTIAVVIARIRRKEDPSTHVDASRAASPYAKRGTGSRGHFLRFALGPASLAGRGATCGGVRALCSNEALDSSRPFHSA